MNFYIYQIHIMNIHEKNYKISETQRNAFKRYCDKNRDKLNTNHNNYYHTNLQYRVLKIEQGTKQTKKRQKKKY